MRLTPWKFALAALLGRLAAWLDRRSAPEPPGLASWLVAYRRPAAARCGCGSPAAADEVDVCHACRAKRKRAARLAKRREAAARRRRELVDLEQRRGRGRRASVIAALLVAPWAMAQAPADGVPLGAYHPGLEVTIAPLGPLDVGLQAEEPDDDEESPEPEQVPAAPPAPLSARLVAAAWCAVTSGAGAAPDPACDIGVGIALWRWCVAGVGDRGCLSPVVMIGAGSAAVGLAWTVDMGGRPVSIGVGVMVPHGSGAGLDLDLVSPAVGATFGFKPPGAD